MQKKTHYDLTDSATVDYNNENPILFKIRQRELTDASAVKNNIRSFIDPYSGEFEILNVGTGKDNAWYKILHLFTAFGHCDLKALIHASITRQQPRYSNYEKAVKKALAGYIDLLRTGEYNFETYTAYALTSNLTVDELIDLLEVEIRLRTKIYQRGSDRYVFVEFAELHYDYQRLYAEYGINEEMLDEEYHPGDPDYEAYKKFIGYITTAEETGLMKNW